MLSGKFVAKGGNADATLRSDFVKVVFFDPMEEPENATVDNSTEKRRNREVKNCSRFATALALN